MREGLLIVASLFCLLLAVCSAAESASWKVERLPGTYKFTEGPAWTPQGTLVFSDCHDNKIWEMKFPASGAAPKVFRDPAGPSNGLTFDKQGRLIACDYGHRRVTRTEKDGKITVLADRFEGKKFNSPNDVVVKSDGSIYFTDPSYGCKDEDRELPYKGVFRIRPDGKVDLLVSDFDMPNGLCFSADESKLYIADSSKRAHIRVMDVAKDGTLSGGKVFATLVDQGVPDGMKIGAEGHLYSSAAPGVLVYDRTGKLVETIPVPEVAANLAWGDKDRKTLYITAQTGVYRARRQ